MPRFSPVAAATSSGGRGPITEHVLRREERQQERYGGLGRPDHVLQALRRGEPVVVSVSLIPREFHCPGWEMGSRVRITPDM